MLPAVVPQLRLAVAPTEKQPDPTTAKVLLGDVVPMPTLSPEVMSKYAEPEDEATSKMLLEVWKIGGAEELGTMRPVSLVAVWTLKFANGDDVPIPKLPVPPLNTIV